MQIVRVSRPGASTRTVGFWFPEKKIFQKRVSAEKHLFRKTRSWGLDAMVVEKLGEAKCKRIEIYDKDSGIMYHLPFGEFVGLGKKMQWGHGDQIFVTLIEWNQKHTRSTGATQKRIEADAVQEKEEDEAPAEQAEADQAG